MFTHRWSILFLAGLGCLASSRVCTPCAGARALDDPGWQARISADVVRSECAFRAVANEPGVWSAPNRSQDLRCRVSREGLEVFPRATNADGQRAAWTFGLRTSRFGRAGNDLALGSSATSATCNRVELEHGPLQEWFENGARGLEQGWTIAGRPAGDGPLRIGLELCGDVSARIESGARSLVLVDDAGDVKLRYRELEVFDARGRALDVRLEASASGVDVCIDDAGADYPLTVDPLLTGPAWMAESDQAGALFGHRVATAGDVNGDGYDDVIIGAPVYDNGQSNEGRVYLYLGSASGLSTTPAWMAEGNQAGAEFGTGLASAGDVNGDGYDDVIIGAPGYDNGQTDEGRVFLYLGSASGLSTSPAWTAESNQAGAWFGVPVGTAGDVDGDGYSDVIISAIWYDNGQTSEGRVFVYLGSATGLSATPAWTAEGNRVGALFGWSSASAGDVNGDGYGDVIVGAIEWSNPQMDEGAAFVYLGSASGLATSAAWMVESDQVGAQFGQSVASAGDVNGDGYGDVIVGAGTYDNGQPAEGRAFVYLGSPSGLATSAAWTAEGDQSNALFGSCVAAAGDVNGDGYGDVIVGAMSYDHGETDEGRAFVYLGSANGLAATPAWTVESDQAGAMLGGSVSTAGDVDGDGYSDVIVGAMRYDAGQTDEGRAFLYLGPSISTGYAVFCAGDGSSTPCPCGNTGAPGHGCANSLFASGAHLSGSGLASIASDSFVLSGAGMPNSSALYFQGTTQVNAGLGFVLADGLRCAGGSIIRLGTEVNSGGGSQYPTGADPRISVRGLNVAGNVRTYQIWYRNAEPTFCTSATSNLTNGLQVTWLP